MKNQGRNFESDLQKGLKETGAHVPSSGLGGTGSYQGLRTLIKAKHLAGGWSQRKFLAKLKTIDDPMRSLWQS